MTISDNTPKTSVGMPQVKGPSAEDLAAAKERFAALLGITFDSPPATRANAAPTADVSTQAKAPTEYEVSTDGRSLQIAQKGSAATQPTAAGPLPTRILPVVEDAAEFSFDPIALLQNRLQRQGIDTSGIQFSQVEQANWNPAGPPLSFNYVRAQFANGLTENYATEWVLYNPDTTATEIGSLIRRGFQPA